MDDCNELRNDVKLCHALLDDAGTAPAARLSQRIRLLLDAHTLGAWQVETVIRDLNELIERLQGETDADDTDPDV